MSIEAMKQALEAIANSGDFLFNWHDCEPNNEREMSRYQEVSEMNEKAFTALRTAIRARGETSEMTLEESVKKFFDYLNRTEESDSGRIFHPVTINCCRVMWMKDLEDTLTKMAELSGSELKRNEH